MLEKVPLARSSQCMYAASDSVDTASCLLQGACEQPSILAFTKDADAYWLQVLI